MNTSQSESAANHSRSKIRQVLAKARDSDKYACRIKYTDSDNQRTERIISPIRFVRNHGHQSLHILALCLGREEPRQFAIAQIESAELVPSADVLMPEPIK